jgi:hypothetical protein
MRTVVMHMDGSGVIWALAKCRVCSEVHKYLAAEAIAGNAICKNCGRPMELQGAVVAAADRTKPHSTDGDRPPVDGRGAGSAS